MLCAVLAVMVLSFEVAGAVAGRVRRFAWGVNFDVRSTASDSGTHCDGEWSFRDWWKSTMDSGSKAMVTGAVR